MTPILVEPSEIHSALKRMWDALEGTNKMRASLFNLIFYTQETPRAQYIRKIAKAVTEKFPSRVIFITEDKNKKESGLKAKVSVLAEAEGQSDIACDLIEMEVSGGSRMQVPFVILPHIIPDLPVYLIWAEDLAVEDPLCDQLQKFAERLILDSESADRLSAFAKSALRHRDQVHIEIADLNWARTESLRDVLHSTFYAEEKLSDLRQAKEIKITYNCAKSSFFCHTKIQAIYLQCWLAAQLGWKLEKIDKTAALYRKEKETVSIQLQGVEEPALPPGMVLTMEISTTNDLHYEFARDKNSPHKLSVLFSTKDRCAMPSRFLFPKSEFGQSLVKEICHKGTSSHYLKVLTMVASMDESFLC